MVKRSIFGRLEFKDDEPIECDCGCTVLPENDIQIHSFDVTDVKGNTKRITLTSCESDECDNNIFFEVLTHHRQVHYAGFTTKHIFSAKEEEEAYYDERYDDDY